MITKYGEVAKFLYWMIKKGRQRRRSLIKTANRCITKPSSNMNQWDEDMDRREKRIKRNYKEC